MNRPSNIVAVVDGREDRMRCDTDRAYFAQGVSIARVGSDHGGGGNGGIVCGEMEDALRFLDALRCCAYLYRLVVNDLIDGQD